MRQVETNAQPVLVHRLAENHITGPKFHALGGQADSDGNRHLSLPLQKLRAKAGFLDGKELTDDSGVQRRVTIPVELQVGRGYDFACETANYTLGAFRATAF